MIDGSYEYFAFISYKREDEKWAKWLQYKLEHYHFPSNLNGRTDLPKDIRPTFRDVTDSKPGLLAEEINNALNKSEWLIIICSPRSARSPWVCKEAQYFIDHKRADHIIPFVIEGTPFSCIVEEECFPQVLLNLKGSKELLAANINEMGREAAAIKVVARMFNLKFDSLWQRHEKEKRLRNLSLIFASLLVSLILAFITIMISMQKKTITNQNYIIREQIETLENNNKELYYKNIKTLFAQGRYIANQANLLYNNGGYSIAIALCMHLLYNDTITGWPYIGEAEALLRKAINNPRLEGWNSTILIQEESPIDYFGFVMSDSTLFTYGLHGLTIRNIPHGKIIEEELPWYSPEIALLSPNRKKILRCAVGRTVDVMDVSSLSYFQKEDYERFFIERYRGFVDQSETCLNYDGTEVILKQNPLYIIDLDSLKHPDFKEDDEHFYSLFDYKFCDEKSFSCFEISPKDQYLIYQVFEKEDICIMNLQNKTQYDVLPNSTCLGLASSHDWLYYLNGNSILKIRDISNKEDILSFRLPSQYVSFERSQNDSILCVLYEDKVEIYNLFLGQLLSSFNLQESGAEQCAITNDGNDVAIKYSNGIIELWHRFDNNYLDKTQNCQTIELLPTDKRIDDSNIDIIHGNGAVSVNAYSSMCTITRSSDQLTVAYYHDAEEMYPLYYKFPDEDEFHFLPQYSNLVPISLTFDKKGNNVLGLFADNSVRLFDPVTGIEFFNYNLPDSFIIDYDPDPEINRFETSYCGFDDNEELILFRYGNRTYEIPYLSLKQVILRIKDKYGDRTLSISEKKRFFID